jgi:hypothetical protein
MSNTRAIIVSACLALLAAAPFGARAEDANSANSDDFAKRLLAVKSVEQKTYACFVRSYDKSHLAHHPKQAVTDMKLLVAAERLPEDAALNYSFRMGLKFRNRKGDFAASSSCGHAEMSEVKGVGMEINCGGECGGGLSIALAPNDKSITVKVESIGIWPANKLDDDSGLALSGGADDRVFRLDRVNNDICAALAREEDKVAEAAPK